MNRDEKNLLEARLKRATEIESRIEFLNDALVRLGGSVSVVAFDLVKGEVWYGNDSNDLQKSDLAKVCWANREPSLVPEALRLFIEMLECRIAAAQKEYEEL
jgi:hypothetical protein